MHNIDEEKYLCIVSELLKIASYKIRINEKKLVRKGELTSLSIVKTLLGAETRSVFDLPEEKSSWIEFIQQRLEALTKGQVEDASGSKSWIT